MPADTVWFQIITTRGFPVTANGPAVLYSVGKPPAAAIRFLLKLVVSPQSPVVEIAARLSLL